VALAALHFAGCKAFEAPTPPPQEIVVRVDSDPDRPVQGAELFFNGKVVAVTDAGGVGKIRLEGRDGETFDIVVKCPAGFQSPTQPTQVVLKRLTDTSRTPQYAIRCPPTLRTVVVAVRADEGPNLPVMYLGREVGRTDSAGAAHVLLQLKPDEQFDLMLSTAEKGNELLQPQNPSSSFFVQGRDEVFTMTHKFTKKIIRHPGIKKTPPCQIGVNCR
jgi:hypothetical protein